MTIVEVKDIFDHIYDKFRDEGILDFEFCRNINTAQAIIVKQYARAQGLPRGQFSTDGFEKNIYSAEDFAPLITHLRYDDIPITFTDTKGRLYKDLIKSRFDNIVVRNLNGIIETKKPEVFIVGDVSIWSDGLQRVCKWVRHNDKGYIRNNPLRKPSSKYPTVEYYEDYYQFNPKGKHLVTGTFLRMPRPVWFDSANVLNNIDPELSDNMMIDVIFRALGLAGINIRERQFFEMVQKEQTKL
jgi:hypothetical protein